MDTGKGKFVQVEADSEEELKKGMDELEKKYLNHGGWFNVGEELIIKGSRFRVQAVKPTTLRLKLLKRKKN